MIINNDCIRPFETSMLANVNVCNY
jgi:hypothetical protein